MHRVRNLILTAAGIVLIVAVRTFIMQPDVVSSDSMRPTLVPGDVVIQNRLGPLLSGVSPGDLVTLLSPESGEPIVKRVVATGGQSVEIYGGRLLVDGQTANEPYVDMHNMSGIFFGPVAVPTGKIFLMGDNRLDSIDSRDFGPVDSGVVQGTILLTMPLGARQ